MARKLSEAAQVAKIVRGKLKEKNIKATVRSSNYAGGDNVNVQLLERVNEGVFDVIKKFCRDYEEGSFNGMEDIYEYDNVNDNVPQTKFLFVSNGK